jgi:hypothetical protein
MMRKFYTLFFFLCLGGTVLAQKQSTNYFNANWAPVSKKDAVYYSNFIPSKENPLGGLRENFLISGEKIEETEYKDFNREIKSGKWLKYFENGQIELEATFNQDGKKTGDFKVYNREGNLVRWEKWANGEMNEGKCFNASGKEIEFVPYEILPQYSTSIRDFYNLFHQNLKIPRNSPGLKEPAFIGFTIDEMGAVLDPHIRNPVDIEIEQAILSAFIKANKRYWIPGKRNGKNDKFFEVMPIQIMKQ